VERALRLPGYGLAGDRPMNMTSEEFSAFFMSDAYQELLIESCSQLNVPLSVDFPEILYQYDVKKLDYSQLTIPELGNTVQTSRAALLRFIKLKFCEDPDDLDGEFPENEMPGEADRSTLVEKLGVYRNFLLTYIIEFTILSARPETITQYLKCVRIPKAVAYAKSLKKWYNEAQGY
jgi:hypothetical protein